MKSMLKSLMSVAAAALAFTSCSNDATEDVMPNVGSQTLKVNASIDQTRTVMADDHINLDWAKDDQIHLYIGASATTAKSIDPVTGGEITGVTYNANDKVYAYYSLPDEGGKTSSGAKNALINIVQEQTQTDANIFAGKNLPMVASSSIENGTVNLLFKPVGCVLAFNVYGQGTTAGEKVKSIKFETSKGCYGYDYCDLTADVFKYEAYSSGTNATVTLTNPATIGASKPSDTKVGENQIYLVVAQAEYPAGSKFTVTTTTDAAQNNTYTFTTTTALDCSQNTARVVNLNLKNAPEMQPAIEVTEVPEQPADEVNNLLIDGIVLKNITASDVKVAVYSDKELTAELTESWLTITNTATLANGKLYCDLAANTDTTPRTVYIGIKYGETVKAAIAITQVGKGSTPAVNAVATYIPSDATYGYNRADKVTNVALDNGAVTLAFSNAAYYDPAVRCYAKSTITVSGSKISKIEIVRASGSDNNTLSASVSTISGDIWTGDSNEVVLTVGGSNGNIRVEKMIITYVEGNNPKIEVPEVGQQPADGGEFTIQGIVFKHIDDVANVTAGVYSDAELTQPFDGAWLQITSSAELANGKLSCKVAANEKTERTAYIGILYNYTNAQGEQQVAKAAIRVTQSASASAVLDTVADVDAIVTTSTYKKYETEDWTVTCGGNNSSLGSNKTNASKRTLKDYAELAEAMGLSTTDYAAAVISKKALPAGYNTATLEYTAVTAAAMVGIAFSTDGVNWTKIVGLDELKSTTSKGSQTYTFDQRGAGYYAFVAKTTAENARIDFCKITYSQE